MAFRITLVRGMLTVTAGVLAIAGMLSRCLTQGMVGENALLEGQAGSGLVG